MRIPEAERNRLEADLQKRLGSVKDRYARLTTTRKVIDSIVAGLLFSWIPACTIPSPSTPPRVLAGILAFVGGYAVTWLLHRLHGGTTKGLFLFESLYVLMYIAFAVALPKDEGYGYIPFFIGVMAAPLLGLLAGGMVYRSYRLASDSE